jgi:thiol-disulfide isomerase/thioredoxin
MPAIQRSILLLLAALFITSATAWSQDREPDGGIRVPAPALPSGLTWLASEPLQMDRLRGKVVLIDFWEYTCVNCIRTFPYLKAWHEKYKDKGLVIIGVHTPEFGFAKDDDLIAKAAKDFGLKYPIISDSDHKVWNTYGNRFWPAKYLIDAQGFVRNFHFGEGAYEATEFWIQKLLREANPDIQLPSISEPIRGTDRPGAVCYPVTPELYLGWERGGHARTLANKEGYRRGQTVTYRDADAGKWDDGLVYLQGLWKNDREALVSARENTEPKDYLAIKYHALEVNSVLRPEDEKKPVKVWVEHDGKPVTREDRGEDIKYDDAGRSYVLVDEARMYQLVKNRKFGHHTLKLAPAAPGMRIYTFTFVSCEVEPGDAPFPPALPF